MALYKCLYYYYYYYYCTCRPEGLCIEHMLFTCESTDPSDVYVEMKYFLHFERKPEYYGVNIIAPCTLLVIISLLVSRVESSRDICSRCQLVDAPVV